MAEIRVRLVPEFEAKMMQGFANEMQSTLGKATGQKEKKGSGGFDIGVGAGGIAKIAGLGALAGGGTMAALELIVEQFKPLVSMIRQISKILIEFLRPIAETIQYLLQPILVMLRPLLQIFNAIFAPYRKAAQQLSMESRQAMNEGDTSRGLMLAGAAASTILKPISDVLYEVQGSLVKMVVDVVDWGLKMGVNFITYALATIAGIFSDTAAEKIRDIGKVTNDYIDTNAEIIKLGIDSAVKTVQNATSTALQLMITSLGSDVIIPKITGTDNPSSLAGLTATAFEMYAQDIKGIVDGTFDPDAGDGLVANFKKNMRTYADAVIQAQNDEFARARNNLKRIRVDDARSIINESGSNNMLDQIEYAGRKSTGIRVNGEGLVPSRVPLSSRASLRRVDGSGG